VITKTSTSAARATSKVSTVTTTTMPTTVTSTTTKSTLTTTNTLVAKSSPISLTTTTARMTLPLSVHQGAEVSSTFLASEVQVATTNVVTTAKIQNNTTPRTISQPTIVQSSFSFTSHASKTGAAISLTTPGKEKNPNIPSVTTQSNTVPAAAPHLITGSTTNAQSTPVSATGVKTTAQNIIEHKTQTRTSRVLSSVNQTPATIVDVAINQASTTDKQPVSATKIQSHVEQSIERKMETLPTSLVSLNDNEILTFPSIPLEPTTNTNTTVPVEFPVIESTAIEKVSPQTDAFKDIYTYEATLNHTVVELSNVLEVTNTLDTIYMSRNASDTISKQHFESMSDVQSRPLSDKKYSIYTIITEGNTEVITISAISPMFQANRNNIVQMSTSQASVTLLDKSNITRFLTTFLHIVSEGATMSNYFDESIQDNYISNNLLVKCCCCCRNTYQSAGKCCSDHSTDRAATCASNIPEPYKSGYVRGTPNFNSPEPLSGCSYAERLEYNPDFEASELFTENFASLSDEIRSSLGDSVTDLVIDCEFNSVACNIER